MAKTGEEGIIFRFATSFDMSSNTSLSTAITKTTSGGAVTTDTWVPSLGTSELTGTPLGTLAANTWASYTTVTGDLDVAGTYTAILTYNNTGGGPDIFISDTGTFTVT